MKETKKRGLSGAHLKWIAVLTMLIDHIGAVLLEQGFLKKLSEAVLAGASYDYLVADYHFWYYFDLVLRLIGRLAFPLFCFLLVEGFLHTKNIRKYFLRLGIFALISEVPFDLAISNSVFSLQTQNVFFTLWIGLLVLYCFRYFEDTLPPHMAFFRYLVPITGILLAEFLQTDYTGFGILMIFLLYELRHSRKWLCIGGAVLSLFQSYTAALAFIPVYFYNGTRGKQSFRYLFYAFYPIHLLVLFFIRDCLCL